MNKFFAIVIVAVWGSLAIVNFFMPKKTFSELENRTLQEWPAWDTAEFIEGNLMLKAEQHLNDHVVGRDFWVELKCKVDLALGKKENNGIFIVNNTLIERVGMPNKNATVANITGINNFATLFKGNIYSMIIPSAIGVDLDKLPSYFNGKYFAKPAWDQTALIDSINGELESSIKNLDGTTVANMLRGHYYRTDHHWTSDCAFAAYNWYAEQAGLPKRNADEFTIETVSDQFYGTLYSKSGFRDITPDEIKAYRIGEVVLYEMGLYKSGEIKANRTSDTVFFDEKLQIKDKYSYFLNDNYGFARITTKSDSGRKLLIFKDSFANSLVPMLLEDYSEIMLVDMRHTTGNIRNIVDFDAYDDALFLYSLDLFTHQDVLESLSRLK